MRRAWWKRKGGPLPSPLAAPFRGLRTPRETQRHPGRNKLARRFERNRGKEPLRIVQAVLRVPPVPRDTRHRRPEGGAPPGAASSRRGALRSSGTDPFLEQRRWRNRKKNRDPSPPQKFVQDVFYLGKAGPGFPIPHLRTRFFPPPFPNPI